jgi:hypothetical protein
MIQHIIGPAPFQVVPAVPSNPFSLSVLSYNVLLPNSVDGWWNYKMYFPPLDAERQYISSWDYRSGLLRDRITAVGKRMKLVILSHQLESFLTFRLSVLLIIIDVVHPCRRRRRLLSGSLPAIF